jgi:hypothetical protein
LAARAVLNLTGDRILPLLQLSVTEELSAFICAIDKDDVCPAFDTHYQVFGNFEELSNAINGDAEFLARLEAVK